MMVVDASAVVELLLRTPLGRRVEARLLDHPASLHAPALLDVEVAQVLRRLEARGELDPARSAPRITLLATLPVSRHPHTPLLHRLWALRANLSAYDATYVALAEALGAVLVTCDARLARATGVHATIDLVC